MFTGIIEEIGTIKHIKYGRNSAVLTVDADIVLQDTKLGDSIAVNGICLTVTKLLSGCFLADIMHETLERSSLAGLACGGHVNLERAMPGNGRFGGHIVTGHVDGVGKITHIRQDDTAVWYTIQTKEEMLGNIVEKGSVSIDGISLTVAKVTQKDFSVSIIPHTMHQTILGERKIGDLVNLETDIIGKYVKKLLMPKEEKEQKSAITREFLEKYGF